jgi:hypothetical protein
MTIQTQPIIIDPASIIAVGELRASRKGRPKKGVVVQDVGVTKTFKLSEQAMSALSEAAAAFGVSESAMVEVFARSLRGCYSIT